MPNCPRCEKPVYFAERVTSIGKDWHRPCLRCENDACKKTLAAGGHSEKTRKKVVPQILFFSSVYSILSSLLQLSSTTVSYVHPLSFI
uniref:LIM zinc-binding domain-containing protein n=1 Tax=Heterorhabditis bacteriophora TaxID=37862 RepID=A0A1I7XRG9_HETBA